MALSLSVMLLLIGVPRQPNFSSVVVKCFFIFLDMLFSFLICASSFSRISGSFICLTSSSLWRLSMRRTARSIFCCFFVKSACVPDQSLEALDGSLQPSMANISSPINPALPHTINTSRNKGCMTSLMLVMKLAMVVKCGWLSADKAIKIMFSLHRRSILRLEEKPRA